MDLCMTGEELRKANECVRECARPCGCSLVCILGSSSVLKFSALTLGLPSSSFTHPHPCAASGVSVLDAIGA